MRPLVPATRLRELGMPLVGPLVRPVDLAACRVVAGAGCSVAAHAADPWGLGCSLTPLHMHTPLMRWEQLPTCAMLGDGTG